MTNQELIKFNKDRKICQIAFVCKDIQKTMDRWIEYLNVGPWKVLSFENSTLENFKVNDRQLEEPFKFIIALAKVGEMQIELLQPVYGPLPYDKFIKEKGEGLHHIKEELSQNDINDRIKFFENRGIGIKQAGIFEGVDIHCIFNSDTVLDFIYEVGNNPDFELHENMYYIYPSE